MTSLTQNCSSQQRNNVYAEEHDMQWCICQHHVKDVQIVEKVCRKNPSVLQIEKFNEFDCITQSEAFANVCLSKELLETAVGTWRDLRITNCVIKKIRAVFIIQ